MTREDKELLRQDLCGQLPYGVIVQYKGHNTIVKNKILTGSDLDCNMEYYKPHLRPTSSMTEEEKKEYHDLCYLGYGTNDLFYDSFKSIDRLNKNMFDYRGLTSKGRALSTEDFNPYEEIIKIIKILIHKSLVNA